MAYADDIDVVKSSIPTLNETLGKIKIEAKKTGLMVNEEKTKYICLTWQKRRDRIPRNATIDKYNFERVRRFKYLKHNNHTGKRHYRQEKKKENSGIQHVHVQPQRHH